MPTSRGNPEGAFSSEMLNEKFNPLRGNWPEGTKPGPAQRKVLRIVREYPDIDIQELSSLMGRSVPTTKNIIRRLHDYHGITLIIPGGPTFNAKS